VKGAFFQKPLEWQLEVTGESWAQGEKITGVLTVKNTSSEAVGLSGAGLHIGVADIKKIHARDEKALKSEFQSLLSASQIAGGETLTWPFEFVISANAAITDKKASYYVTYGPSAKESSLQLNIVPRKLFGEITKVFETFQRFKPKDIKGVKGAVEYKLIPPTSREYAHVEALLLEQSLNNDVLQLKYTFKVKTLDTASVTTKVAKDEKVFLQELTSKQYSLGRDMPNQDGILKALDEVLNQVKMKGL
jgi:hypothetical protein